MGGPADAGPPVRAAAPATITVAGGFSCRTQIAHSTARRGRHIAEVIALAYRQAARCEGRAPAYPERRFPEEPAAVPAWQQAAAAGMLAFGSLALLAHRAARPRRR